MIALSQSRKAFLVMGVGIFLCCVLYNLGSKNLFKNIDKIFLIFIVLIILYNYISSLSLFSGMMERVNRLIASFTGEGKVDNSTLIRNKMIEIGFEQFMKTPLLGMGMANPHYLSNAYLGKDAYLHNNFIELLAGGGIVGFLIYYSMYTYILKMLWKFRKFKNREYTICLVLAVVLIILDWGMVSYYQKIRYIYLMMLFLEIDALKKIANQK